MVQRLALTPLRLAAWSLPDQQAWARAQQAGGLFDDDGGLLAQHPPERRRRIAKAYGRWLAYLVSQGQTPRDCGWRMTANPTLLQGFVSCLDAVAPITARGYLTDLLTACRALAPGMDFALLHRAVRHSWRHAKPVIDRQSQLLPARDLYQLGHQIMDEASMLPTPIAQANAYRDGLMMALLIACPLRIRNFAQIRHDRHLQFDGARYRLHFGRHETKNKQPLMLLVPEDLHPALKTWLDIYRPICLARRGRWWQEGDHDALWISDSGAPYVSGKTLSARLARLIEARTGKRLTAHLFRHSAATSIASEIPEDVGIIRAVLGHSSLQTGERYYNQATSLRAATKLQAALDQFRTPDSIPDHIR